MASQSLHSHWLAASGSQGGDSLAGARFPYWSFTKTAISICALKLVENAALELDTPLRRHPFTLRQLLKHTSGLPDYGALREYHGAVARGEEPWPREKLLDRALAQGMLFSSGDGWSYSNIGYLFVRELIEETTGMPIGDVMSDWISRPLGLETVEFWDTLDQSASLHCNAAKGYDPRWVYHGCLIGAASDAARLLHALFKGDLLEPDTLNAMLDRHAICGPLPGRPWADCGYALGLMSGKVDGLGTALGHSGGGPFSVSAIYHFPDGPDPVTVACFAGGTEEGTVEFTAVNIAQDIGVSG